MSTMGESMRFEKDGGETASLDEEPFSGDSETWGLWEVGLVLGSVVVGTTGLVTLGWAVERFILS
jgi:hypothetical protein